MQKITFMQWMEKHYKRKDLQELIQEFIITRMIELLQVIWFQQQ